MWLQLPDYVLVCVCPLAGLSRVSHEHLAVALALEIPVACVITKPDIAPPEAVEQVMQDIRYEPPTILHCLVNHLSSSGHLGWSRCQL